MRSVLLLSAVVAAAHACGSNCWLGGPGTTGKAPGLWHCDDDTWPNPTHGPDAWSALNCMSADTTTVHHPVKCAVCDEPGSDGLVCQVANGSTAVPRLTDSFADILGVCQHGHCMGPLGTNTNTSKFSLPCVCEIDSSCDGSWGHCGPRGGAPDGMVCGGCGMSLSCSRVQKDSCTAAKKVCNVTQI